MSPQRRLTALFASFEFISADVNTTRTSNFRCSDKCKWRVAANVLYAAVSAPRHSLQHSALSVSFFLVSWDVKYFQGRLNSTEWSNGTEVVTKEYYFNNWMTLLSQLPLLLFTLLNSILYQRSVVCVPFELSCGNRVQSRGARILQVFVPCGF